MGKVVFVHDMNAPISYSFNSLCAGGKKRVVRYYHVSDDEMVREEMGAFLSGGEGDKAAKKVEVIHEGNEGPSENEDDEPTSPANIDPGKIATDSIKWRYDGNFILERPFHQKEEIISETGLLAHLLLHLPISTLSLSLPSFSFCH